MSIARHHAEWLSLVEISGPFLSLPVLMRVFSTGLDVHEPELSQRVRSAYGEWQESRGEVAIHRAWVDFVLREVLALPETVLLSGQTLPPGLQVTIAQQHETLRPDWAIVEPDAPHQPRMLVQRVSPEQGLEKPLKGSKWSASPATRMMELLHATGVRLGLVTNGEQWMLVNAPKGETTGFISWYGTLWLEEPLTLRAFRSLLGVGRWFSVAADETLEGLLAASATDQQEVTDQLGYQVRQAVEVLVGAIGKLERDGVVEFAAPGRLYEAVLTVMMRLVFLFCAEERGLIPSVGTEFYQANYAVATLRESLRLYADRHGEEILERRSDAWCRLLATFRAVYAGVDHDVLHLPAYGGSLFDPNRFPFLEGRGAGSDWRVDFGEPIAVNNRVVLHLLEALQLLQIRVVGAGVETRRMSFRALDIEQIGHVYEGLLDHTAVRSQTPVLGLKGTKYEEPEIELEMLEGWIAKPEKDYLKWLKEQTGRSESALKKDLAVKLDGKALPELFLGRLMTVCENDRGLYDRVLPFVGLLRVDTLGYPVVIGSGMVYVTAGTDRRSTGTHYTPRSLTEEIVQYTLEPLVYVGPGEGLPREEWRLRSAVALLRLKVCDIAMGSGAFLVQVCRYLAERVVEAWGQEQLGDGELRILPDGSLSIGDVSEDLLPIDPQEQLLVARRLVADRCLYGVDKNPLAVEMAKLSLWLITLQKNRPFTFVDHALKCGDSLLGLTRAEQIEFLKLNPERKAVQLKTVSDRWKPFMQRAIAKRRELASFSVNGIGDLAEKDRLFREAEDAIENVRFVGDFLVAEALADAGKTSDLTSEELQVLAELVVEALDEPEAQKREREIAGLKSRTNRMMNLGNPTGNTPRKPFHWLLEFPEVFLEGQPGFSAIVGNPPFQKGSKITGVVGMDYRNYLVEYVANGQRGTADLCAYFFLNAVNLLQPKGRFGLVATNTIAQGDTREVGLDQIAVNHVIARAVPSRPWPGTASLEVAHVWLQKGEWKGESVLDDQLAPGITPYLNILNRSNELSGKPYQLLKNKFISFKGSDIYGLGFIVSEDEVSQLIQKNPCNKDILFRYLNGDDLNSRPDQSPSRWIINFRDWPLDSEHDDLSNPKGRPYAIEYPDCLNILIERVKEEREKLATLSNSGRDRARRWWQFSRPTMALYAAIEGRDRILVVGQTSKYHSFVFTPEHFVFDQKTVVFPFDQFSQFCILQSTIHTDWVLSKGSSLETRPVYTPTDCFETFPFPENLTALETIGETYYTHRQTIMQTHQQGLTKTYNRFHNPDETAPDITHLRQLHIQMDQAVAAAYGWANLPLDHGFHPTKQGIRFTISESARREVLDRLLQLNHERYAAEVEQGLHDKKHKGKGKQAAKKTTRKAQAAAPDEPAEIQGNLFLG